MIEIQRADSFDDRVRSRQGCLLVVVDEQECELVAAEPKGLASLPQLPRNLRKYPVSGRMPETVVDVLEVIDVDEAERQRGRAFLRRLQLALQSLVEVPVVSQPGEWIRQRQAHRPQRSVRRALVERDREQRADKRGGEHRRALPEHDEHQRGGSHERERDDRCPDVRADERDVSVSRAQRHRRRDQHDVDDVVGGRRDHDARDDGPDPVAVDGRDQRARRERDQRKHRDVVGDPLERPVLRELHDRRRKEQEQGAGSPAVEDDGRDREHERQ